MKHPLMSSFLAPGMSGLIIKDDRSAFELIDDSALALVSVLPDAVSPDVLEAAARDKFPIPQLKDREYYHGDHHALWWMSGLDDVRGMQRAANKLSVDFDRARYYEIGCASGRVVRHVAAQTNAKIWCSDINIRHVEWIRQHLPAKINVFSSTAFPSLPVESNYFDVISAFSVFTHIDDLESMWLAEIHRILRPGGLAYITVATEGTWEKYKNDWVREKFLPLADSIIDYKVDDAFFKGPLPKEKTVILWNTRNIYNNTVFHSTDYIRREWGRFFDIKDIVPNGHAYQDVVIMTKASV